MIYWGKKYFSNPAVHWQALYEVLITAVFSLAPIIISLLTASLKRSDGSFISPNEFVGRGQVFLLAYGLYGTIFWLSIGNGEYPRHGARALLGTIATILIFPVVALSGVDPTFSTILNPQVVQFSYWLYGIFLFLNYLLLFYMKIQPPEPKDVYKREAATMRDAYEDMTRHG